MFGLKTRRQLEKEIKELREMVEKLEARIDNFTGAVIADKDDYW